MTGRVLTIHLVEGSANGLQTAEIDNWIGKVFVAPRTDLPSLLQQPEMKGLGAYVLIGDDPNHINRNTIYIGQGQVANRLTLHSSDDTKTFWDNKTLVVVAKDNSLNTADCLYLESRLIELANNAKSSTLTNGQYPSLPNMAATDRTRVENFLAQIQVLLPVLNINFFVAPPKLPQATSLVTQPRSKAQTVPHNGQVQPVPPAPSPFFVLVTGAVSAEAQVVNNKFVVRQGASVNANEAQSIGKSNSALRSQLRTSGKLVDGAQSGRWVFAEDVAFGSPSAAAAVICGFSIAGPQVWKVKGTQQTYGEWLQAQVNAVTVASVTP